MRALLLLVLFTGSLFRLSAQPEHDKIIVEKYQNDSTGFKPYPKAPLLPNLCIAGKYSELQVNTWYSKFMLYKSHPKTEFKNLYSYPPRLGTIPDSVVLSKTDPLKCFTSCWCPGFDPWYISARDKKGNTVTINSMAALKDFLTSINNIYDAYLWLHAQDYLILGEETPIATSNQYSYKKVKDGYLIKYRGVIGNVPVTDADLVYFIGLNFRVILISKKNLRSSNYKI